MYIFLELHRTATTIIKDRKIRSKSIYRSPHSKVDQYILKEKKAKR